MIKCRSPVLMVAVFVAQKASKTYAIDEMDAMHIRKSTAHPLCV